ncbi:MAG: PDZ domain-containing protein [Synergistaceae bacterium]|jgi:hypothetical protein|nr:PDZ domain-containing protein [Synergistaceae bacterium]
MKRVLFAVALLACFVFPAGADVYYYQNPSTVYVRPDPSYEAGKALGNLLGAMIQSSNQKAAQQEQEKAIRELQNTMDNIVKSDTSYICDVIYQSGLEVAWSEIDKYIYSLGSTPYKNISDGIAVMSFTKYLNDGFQLYQEYSINMRTQQCRSVVRFSPGGPEAVYVATYILPQRQISETEAVSSYLGVVASTEKTKEGGFSILEVEPQGLSEFAGFQKGDILTKIDTYDLKEYDIERVAGYIALRRQQKAIIKATILRDGQTKTIEMQL